jgi:hypothetical protein
MGISCRRVVGSFGLGKSLDHIIIATRESHSSVESELLLSHHARMTLYKFAIGASIRDYTIQI